jgi:tetratricopeptide (TPR) repeat protein
MHLLEPDIDNIRHAWQTGLSAQNTDLLLNALTPLSIYYQLRGLAHEGEHIMHSTMSAAATWGSDGIPLATRAGLERARFQNRLGQYRPAIQTIQTTLKLAEQCADRWAEGMAHVWWGESLWRLGDYDVAKEKLTHALVSGQALDANLIIGWCHHQLGIIHDIQSRYAAAHDHLEKACAAWRELDNTNTLSVSLNSLGLVYYNQGDLRSAKDLLEQSLTLCNQVDNRHLQSFLLNNLSIITTTLGDYLGAQYYIQLGLELASSTSNLTGQAQLHINLGRTYRLLGELDSSVASLEKGLQISKALDNQYIVATALLNLANTKQAQADLEEAASLYNQTIKLSRQSNLPSIECQALTDLAELLSVNDLKQAQKYSSLAVALAESIKKPDLIKRANTLNYKLQASELGNGKRLSE